MPATKPIFHGNWCGIGGNNRAKPVDPLDALYREHDLCWERLGYHACPCDQTFIAKMARLSQSPGLDEAIRTKAATASKFFAGQPCDRAGRHGRGTKRH